MSLKVLRDAAILMVLFGIGWAVFTYSPWFKMDDLDDTFPIETEEDLGDLVLDLFYNEKVYERVEGNAADSALVIIAERLLENIELTEYDYNIQLVRSEQINAFTLPGGNIVVFTGLLEFAETPEEVAAVLAHEMGHVEERHTIDALMREFSLSILFTMAGGNESVLLNDVLQSLISTGFSRGQEAEADEFSLELLHKSKISPRALASFFRRLNRKYGSLDEELEIFLTHPAKNSRIKSAMEYELPEDFEEIPYDLDWDAVKASISADSTNS